MVSRGCKLGWIEPSEIQENPMNPGFRPTTCTGYPLPGWGHENALDTSYSYGTVRSMRSVLVHLTGQALPAHPSGQSPDQSRRP